MLLLIGASYLGGAALLVFGYGSRPLAFGAGAFLAAAAGATHALLAGLRRAIGGRSGALRRAAITAAVLFVCAGALTLYGVVRF